MVCRDIQIELWIFFFSFFFHIFFLYSLCDVAMRYDILIVERILLQYERFRAEIFALERILCVRKKKN